MNSLLRMIRGGGRLGSLAVTRHPSCLRSASTQPSAIVADGKIHLKARLDYKYLEENLDEVKKNLQIRGCSADPEKVLRLYENQCRLISQINGLRHEKNNLSATVNKTNDVEKIRLKGQLLKQELAELEARLHELSLALDLESMRLPNRTHPDVPIGFEEDSVVLSTHGSQPTFSFSPLDHVELIKALDLADFQTASSVAGAGFVNLCNEAVLLELALVQWALSKLREKGFRVMLPPDVAHWQMVEGCGFQPRGASSQVYNIKGTDLCLMGTSEIALAGSQTNKILDSAQLPMKLGAFTHCFRMETGHGGRGQRGLYRLHQFSKVEMFSYCTESQSEQVMIDLLDTQIELFNELGIHFRVMDMASGDLGAPAYRKLDIEAWMPGRGEYGEISSLSNCTDYQTRRLNVRHRSGAKENTQYAYSLNGTACAIPRIIISILETYQQEDGSVIIPEVLRPYMNGLERIAPKT